MKTLARKLYEKLDATLQGGRDKNQRKAAKNTWVRWYGLGRIAVCLHNTHVLVVDAKADTITVSTGTWTTATTKARINEYLPAGYGLYQKEFRLYWYSPVEADDGLIFHDGDYINKRGRIVQPSTK